MKSKKSIFLKKSNHSHKDMYHLEIEDKGRIKGIGKVAKLGLTYLNDVMQVEVLTNKLINIGQLSDQGFNVSFNKVKCIVSSNGQ